MPISDDDIDRVLTDDHVVQPVVTDVRLVPMATPEYPTFHYVMLLSLCIPSGPQWHQAYTLTHEAHHALVDHFDQLPPH